MRFGNTKGEIQVIKGDFRGHLGVWTWFGNQPPHLPIFFLFPLYQPSLLKEISLQVIPFLPRPLLLTDFLLTSYSVGGAISLLALSSVYTLISQHNLEFPQFYVKLYQLFSPEVMHVKYRARFFHLSSLFLSSTHLPEYLVAAFVKRLARLCLTAPAHCIPMSLRFLSLKTASVL